MRLVGLGGGADQIDLPAKKMGEFCGQILFKAPHVGKYNIPTNPKMWLSQMVDSHIAERLLTKEWPQIYGHKMTPAFWDTA